MALRVTGVRLVGAAAAAAVTLALASCAQDYRTKPLAGPSAAELAAHARDPAPAEGAVAPAPDAAKPADAPAAPPPGPAIEEPPPPEIIRGTGRLVGSNRPVSAAPVAGEEGGITLNFINADVRDVAKAIFGDFLGVNYSIGAGVQGTVTVQTSKPVSRAEVLPIFEQILRMNGLAVVKNNDVYKVVLSADAPREVSAPAQAGTANMPGYGTQVIPLRYVAAAEILRLLEPMQPAQAIVRADPGRNLIIVQGTQQERQAVMDEIALFDVDWLAGMSFGLFTPKYTDARGLVKELNQVLGGVGGPLNGIVKLVPIERLNTVLVISPQPRYLDQMQRWIARLDRPGLGSDRRIFVYAVQNGRAADLASVLKKVLYGTDNARSGSSGDGGADAATAPPVPGAPAAAPVAAPAPPANNNTVVTDSDSGGSSPPGQATITADETNNAIVIYGTPQQYATIDAALRQLDIAPLQVLLEAVIAEVTLTNDLRYGVQYLYNPSNKHDFVLSNAGTAAIGSTLPGFSYVFSEGSNIKVVLDTLSKVTRVEVISSPEIFVLNNHTATLTVGDQVPIATSQAVSVSAGQAPIVNTIEYRSTGVILKVTPRVNQGGMVMLEISQEVSDVSTTNTSTLDSPTITQRKIESTISVKDSETIALGGLIKNDKNSGSSGLPYLSEIPVLGGLFGTQSKNFTRTELIVLITPHVVDNLQKARAVTEELRRKLPSLQTLLR